MDLGEAVVAAEHGLMDKRELFALVSDPGESVQSIVARLLDAPLAERTDAVAWLMQIADSISSSSDAVERVRIDAIRGRLETELTLLRSGTSENEDTRLRVAESPRAQSSEHSTKATHVTEQVGLTGDRETVTREARTASSAREQRRADASEYAGLVLREGSVVHSWYRLESPLGVGAMGQVWKATDLQRERLKDPQPHVALKLVSEEFARHEHAMVAMQREASKAQELAHPNIATVFVFAFDPGTAHGYLAMELLTGKPLDRLIRDNPGGSARDAALDVIRGLARGLGYAHSKGIVHCDFKPGNAFVTDAGVAKVLDFGIARLAHEVARAGDDFDAGVLQAMTPKYASYEMLAEEALPPHPADDVYALGLVAYELLSGRHPFAQAFGKLAEPADLRRVLATRPKLVPIKGLKRHEWRAIERALRLERGERWTDAQEFLRALEGSSPRARVLGALAATLAVGAGYAGYLNWQERQPAQPFDALPAGIKAEFREAMNGGDDAYEFSVGASDPDEAAMVLYRDAVPLYAEAYSLHPKNPNADRALRQSLVLLQEKLEQVDPQTRKEAAMVLRDYRDKQFPSLRRFGPLDDAIRTLDE